MTSFLLRAYRVCMAQPGIRSYPLSRAVSSPSLGMSLGLVLCITIAGLPHKAGATQSHESRLAAAATEPPPAAAHRPLRPGETPRGLSQADWGQILGQLEQHRYRITPDVGDQGHFHAWNQAQQWTADFTADGARLRPEGGEWEWGLKLKSYGYGERNQPVQGMPTFTAEGNRLHYQWSPELRETYRNDRDGVEQIFVLEHRPDGADRGAPLRLDLAVQGGLRARVTSPTGTAFVGDEGSTVLTYSGLAVYDADGRTLPAWFEGEGARLTIAVDDTSAHYPLTVDPTAQQAYLKASNTGAGDNFGYSVAIHGDTVVVGANVEASNATGINGDGTNNSASYSGAAYVFVRSGTTWTQQAYLKASNTGSNDEFGRSVALFGDTLVVGAYAEDSNATGVNGDGANNGSANSGAAYVYVRNGTTWSQQAYLKASNAEANDYFGWSVALSGDTLAVSAYAEDSAATGVNGNGGNNSAFDSGAVYVFTRSGTTWSQQAYLKASNTETGDYFGWSVALSDDTLAVGAYAEDSAATGVNGNGANNSASNSGAAFVFVRNGTTWSQQAYLKASNAETNDEFGRSVALSGNTVVVGAHREDSNATGANGDGSNNVATDSGAAYVYVRSGSTWSQQAYLKASNTDINDNFGWSVALSGDTVAVGAYAEDSNATGVNGSGGNNLVTNSGAAYVFVRSGAAWSQQSYLKASNTGTSDNFGWSVALSGTTIVVGAIGEASNATGVNGDGTNNLASASGAAYLFLMPSYTVTPSAGEGGSISPATPQTVNAGATASFTVTPAAGYSIASMGGTCGGSLTGSTYTTATITADCTVTASFSLTAHAITASSNPAAGGTVACSPNPVGEGSSASCTATAHAGYSFTGFSGDCTGSTCTWSNVTAPKNVTANFTPITYGISSTVSPSTGGTVSCSPNPVSHGDDATCTATAHAGYTFSGFSGDCAGPACLLNGVTGSRSVTANFTLNSYSVIPNLPRFAFGGSISPSTPQAVGHGATASYTVTTDPGFAANISGTCGGALSGSTYTTAPIVADCMFAVSFEPDRDADGIGDSADNCPTLANPGQADGNADGRGDACPVYYVNASAPAGGNGLSWSTAFRYLSTALDYGRRGGGEIWVAQGLYYPDQSEFDDSNDPAARFEVPDKLRLLGGFAGGETSAADRNGWTRRTILSGDIDQDDLNLDGNGIAEQTSDLRGSNSSHVVSTAAVSATTWIDGFFVTAGNASGGSPDNAGGGWLNQGGSPLLSRVFLIGNNATVKGGAFLSSGGNPGFVNVAFTGNAAASGAALMAESGSYPVLVNATISANSGSTGAVSADGGGLILRNVILWGNPGGALSLSNGASAAIDHSLVQGSGGSGSGWQSAFGTDGGDNLDTSPMLLNPAGGRLSLASRNSPVFNAGDAQAIASFSLDLAGQARVQGSSVDLGAMESNPVDLTSEDMLTGTDAADILTAQTINTKVKAEAGDDVVISSRGRQVMNLGDGRDTVVWSSFPDSDVIQDFVLGEDTLDVRPILALFGYSGNDPLASGHLVCASAPGGVLIRLDRDGAAGSVFSPISYATVKGSGVTPASLCEGKNFIFPSGIAGIMENSSVAPFTLDIGLSPEIGGF